MGINQGFSATIFGGNPANDNVPAVGPVAIAGHIYQVEPSKCHRQTLDALRASSDVQKEPGEQSFATHGLWRRHQRDWRHGAGQQYFDEADSINTRFGTSKGVNVLTPRQVTLLPDTELLIISANTNLQLLSAGDYMLLSDGATLKWSHLGDAFLGSTAATATIGSVTSDGSHVYVAPSGANPVLRGALGGALAAFGVFQADVVGYGNGRLLAAKANRIVELDNAGAIGTLDKSHFNTGFTWKGMVATASAIYAWGDSGGRSEVYSIVVDPSTGNLLPPAFAWPVPIGETVLTMVWDVSVMLIGTDQGVRLATENSSSHTLEAGALLEAPGAVRSIAAYRSQAWFTWTNLDTDSTGIGRMALNRLVDPANLVPAYSSDLMAAGQGTVLSVGSIGDKRVFTVQGHGLYVESSNLVPQGWVSTGWINFSTVERKMAVSVDVRHRPLVGSISIAADYDVAQDEGGTRHQLSTSTVAGTLGPSAPFSTGNESYIQAAVIATLVRSESDPTVGPALGNLTLRSLATPLRTDEIIVCIRMTTAVSGRTPNTMPTSLAYRVLDEFLFLKALEATGKTVRLQEGHLVSDVIIDGIVVEPIKLAADGSFWESLTSVRMLTVTPIA